MMGTVARWPLVLRAHGFVGLAILVVATACGSPESAALTATVEDLGHVHDVIVDEGTVFLASHTGMFRVDGPERATLVGQYRHDLMSMDSAPGRLVASGHPDLRFEEWRVAGKPPHLGFVTSDDLGKTWSSVALLGEVDFHSLTTRADGGYFGADSAGVILASVADTTWELRSNLQAVDLAASPQSSEDVVAIDAETGLLLVSRDGARTWGAIALAPALQRVQWRADGLAGIAADGSLHTTDMPAGAWTQIGQVEGQPVAFTTEGDDWWIVTDEAVVLHTTDGLEFDTVYVAPRRPGS